MSLIYSMLNEEEEFDFGSSYNTEDELFSEDATYFCEGVDGLFEISAESEASWGNIMCESIVSEHVATMNEDVAMLQEAEDSFFKKVQEWVKKKARQLKQFFTDLMNRIKIAVMNTDKFVRTNEAYFRKVKTAKIKSKRKWVNPTLNSIMNDADSMIGAIIGMAGTNKIVEGNRKLDASDIYKAVGKKVGLNIEKSSDLREKYTEKYVKISKDAKEINCSVADFAPNLLGAKIGLKLIQQEQKMANSILSSILAAAKVEDKEDAGNNKASIVTFRKNCSSAVDNVTGITTSLYMQLLSDSLAVCKSAIKTGKKSGALNKKDVQSKNGYASYGDRMDTAMSSSF